MSTLKLRAAAASALFCLALAGGPATAAHAMKNDGRYAKTVGSRAHVGPGNSSFCGDWLNEYNYYDNQANGFIAQWQFGKANAALDQAAKFKNEAADQGCAWPYAV